MTSARFTCTFSFFTPIFLQISGDNSPCRHYLYWHTDQQSGAVFLPFLVCVCVCVLGHWLVCE